MTSSDIRFGEYNIRMESYILYRRWQAHPIFEGWLNSYDVVVKSHSPKVNSDIRKSHYFVEAVVQQLNITGIYSVVFGSNVDFLPICLPT